MSAREVDVFVPKHIAIDEASGKADCSVCHCGITAPPSFGGIPCPVMLATFTVQHSVHDSRGYASGLTKAGNPTRAARAAMRADA